jgi:AbrB family looped-hinge helix DNA binding protein
MKTTMDSAGRLVIPRDIRVKANITPQTLLEVTWHDGRIEIEPVPAEVHLAKKGKLLVAQSKDNRAKLKGELVEETRRRIRNDR